jgi:hypothetical protein
MCQSATGKMHLIYEGYCAFPAEPIFGANGVGEFERGLAQEKNLAELLEWHVPLAKDLDFSAEIIGGRNEPKDARERR